MLQANASSVGQPDLSTIVEAEVSDNDDENGWDDDDDGDNNAEHASFDAIDSAKLQKMQQMQAMVDELKSWNEFMDIFGVSCYYHSLWILLQSNDCKENEGKLFKMHSAHIWKCIVLLIEELNTMPAGIEFAEFFLNVCFGKLSNLKVENKSDLNKLLNGRQFNEHGLWQMVQSLTSRLKGINDRALHQKVWQLIVHLINVSDLQSFVICVKQIEKNETK